MTINEFVHWAVGVPFVEKGRDYSGWDCWGSVWCAYRDVYGIFLPKYLDYESTVEYEQLRLLIDHGKKTWVHVTKPQSGDVAVFNISGAPCHVAMVVDGRNALHAERKIGTFIEPLNSIIWKKRLEGFYRYERFSKNDSGLPSFQG